MGAELTPLLALLAADQLWHSEYPKSDRHEWRHLFYKGTKSECSEKFACATFKMETPAIAFLEEISLKQIFIFWRLYRKGVATEVAPI